MIAAVIINSLSLLDVCYYCKILTHQTLLQDDANHLKDNALYVRQDLQHNITLSLIQYYY